MKTKRFICLLVVLAMLVSVAACVPTTGTTEPSATDDPQVPATTEPGATEGNPCSAGRFRRISGLEHRHGAQDMGPPTEYLRLRRTRNHQPV